MSMDANTIAQQAVRYGLVTIEQMEECLGELPPLERSAEAVLKIFERKAYLTPFQANKLIKGDYDGYILGGFRILYKIASGTFGRVYRADDPRSGQIVAIKVLRKKHLMDARKVDLFEREGKNGLELKHPNIVEILAVNRDPSTGQYYIVMEFVEGGNLRDFLKIRKKLQPAEALRLLEETAAGLGYAYSRGMTHRDIKATNILIATAKNAKLVDFGLAELTGSRQDVEGTVDQSVDYVGLEKATGTKAGDIRSDIFFLGCVFYQMLKGEPLLEMTRDLRARKNPNRFRLADKLRRDDPELPGPIFGLLQKMVAFEPAARFQNPQVLVDAVQHARAELAGEQGIKKAVGPKTVFVVEHHEGLQNVFRERLKKYGYRVLISIHSDRVLERFKQNPFSALIVDVGTAGDEGIAAFESVMDEAEYTRMECTGVLILSENQSSLVGNFKKRPNVTVLVRPVSLKQILKSLATVEQHNEDMEDNAADEIE